ncbi:MAG: HEAT repeat domain-containing protein, partial [Candidatus Zixiibacteriota bacterium]
MRVIAAIAVLLLAAIVIYYLYDTFRERTQTEKLAEIIHLEDKRSLSGRLKKYLKDEDPVIRARAALAVGRIGGPGSGELLYRMISDGSFDVAATAAFALGLTGDRHYATKLLDVAYDLPSAVGTKAVAATGYLADSSMAEVADRLVEYL